MSLGLSNLSQYFAKRVADAFTDDGTVDSVYQRIINASVVTAQMDMSKDDFSPQVVFEQQIKILDAFLDTHMIEEMYDPLVALYLREKVRAYTDTLRTNLKDPKFAYDTSHNGLAWFPPDRLQ